MISISQDKVDEIQRHAESSYPYECCGLLIGKVRYSESASGTTGSKREVLKICPIRNRNVERAVDRYEMDPNEFNQADKDARKSGYDIIGIYHSHPDHPPRPSNFDAERAWAGYSYFIIAVKNGKKETLISWVFDEAKKGFDEEEIKIG
ncbi:MAG TPA: Mov34/MPN/PAD-1 family protein [Candidatus Brocadiia bacterium]|nr:M67 family metallopeptidase [Candidatus Brocadiales bacterium]